MKKHVINICQPAYLELKRISSIRRFLTENETKTFITSYILSRLHYSVSSRAHLILSSNLSKKLKTLQQDSSSWHLVITTLHLSWKSCTGFPFLERIKYKVACISFHAINGSGPTSSRTLTYLHSVSHASLFLRFPHAQNPTIQTQDSWLSHLHLLWTLCLEFTSTRHLFHL